jgi:hypothetical protein
MDNIFNLASISRRLAVGVLAVVAGVVLSVAPAKADFRGGGIINNFTEQCPDYWPRNGTDIVRARYRASEVFGNFPSSVTLAFTTGSMQVSLWGPMTPSQSFFGGSMRYMFTEFFFQPGGPVGPRVRVVQRLVTERLNPSGPNTVENARELVLRLRVQNFDGTPGCAVTIATTLRRRQG